MANDPPSLAVASASISRRGADMLIAAAIDAAQASGIEIAVAVVDVGGALKSFSRTDHAPFLTGAVATDKAWTAASFGYPTHVWNALMADPKLAPLGLTPRLVAVGGGVPIMAQGTLIGGIGISGGTYDQDQQIAEAALAKAGLTA